MKDIEEAKGRRVKKTVLKADEICSILKTGAEAKVKVLKYLGLEIHYQVQASEETPQVSDSNLFHVEQLSTGKAKPVANTQAFEDAAYATKQEQLDQMLIEDPSQYEALVAAGDIEDAAEEREDQRA